MWKNKVGLDRFFFFLQFFKTDTKKGIEIHKRLFVNIIHWLTFLLTLLAEVCSKKGAHYYEREVECHQDKR